MKNDPLTAIDFYKADHRRQYPEGTELVYSNFTARSNKLSNLPNNNDKIVFFGLQFFMKEFLQETFNEGFFDQPKEKVVAKYKRRMDNALGPNAIPVDHIEALHDLGYLPLEIRALPEGSKVKMGVPLFTVCNTHPDFFWLVNYIESVMSAYLWKPCVSATTANWYKNTLTKYALETGSPVDFVNFQGHDFSFRGMSGLVDAKISGAAHLLSFYGTDTVGSIDLLEDYYGANSDKELIGTSVPATEHSVMCMGTKDAEIETFRRLIKDLYPSGIVSIVSDTWDFWKVVTEYVAELKEEILAREGNPIANKVVIRPDSGDPVDIICGTLHKLEKFESPTEEYFLKEVEEYLHDKISRQTPHGEYGGDITEDVLWQNKIYTVTYSPDWNRHDKQYYYIDNYGDKTPTINKIRDITPEDKGAIQCLWDVFGGTITSTGHKLLDSHIGLIYGDSITPNRAVAILDGLKANGFASANVVLGIGSFTYQYTTRDTYGFAVKATYGVVNGEGREIFKDPATDIGKTKKSAKGLLQVFKDEKGDFVLKDQVSSFDYDTTNDLMPTVFHNGNIMVDQTLEQIRQRIITE